MQSVSVGGRQANRHRAIPANCRIGEVPRNAEVIRHWTILRAIERARGGGVTINDLARSAASPPERFGATCKPSRRPGFPLYDDRSHDDGRTRWAINGQAFRSARRG